MAASVHSGGKFTMCVRLHLHSEQQKNGRDYIRRQLSNLAHYVDSSSKKIRLN